MLEFPDEGLYNGHVRPKFSKALKSPQTSPTQPISPDEPLLLLDQKQQAQVSSGNVLMMQDPLGRELYLSKVAKEEEIAGRRFGTSARLPPTNGEGGEWITPDVALFLEQSSVDTNNRKVLRSSALTSNFFRAVVSDTVQIPSQFYSSV